MSSGGGLARFTAPRQGRLRTAADLNDARDHDGDRESGATAANGAPSTQHVVEGDVPMAPALQAVLTSRRRAAPGESCELCAADVAADHRHVVDLERRSLLCACRGCALLFDRGGADPARYRAVPDRYQRIAPVHLPAETWAALQIPVGVCFVVANTQLDSTVAFYPSPGGATESELPLDAWHEIVAANPALADVEPDVEAVLVRTDTTEPLCHVVPVDRCYELVGLLRRHWRGFDGGAEVRAQLDAFFADVAARSRDVPGAEA